MNFKISNISKNNGWISISHDDYDESGGMVRLIKSIQNEIGGNVVNIVPDDTIYSLTNDKFKLKFQWDSNFGTVVVLNDLKDLNQVVEMLKRQFEKLNAE